MNTGGHAIAVAPPPAPLTPVPPWTSYRQHWLSAATIHAARVATHDATGAVTYAELHARADRIAARLLDTDATSRGPIPILMERGADPLAAMLGVLGAGACFAGLSPTDPPARLRRMLQGIGARILLTHGPCLPLANTLAHDGIATLDIATLPPADGAIAAATRAAPIDSPDAPSYIVFTSGSTGQPKAVLHRQANTLHESAFVAQAFALHPDDRVSLFATVAGAASVSAALATLLEGACLFPLDLKNHGVTDLAAWLARERISLFQTAPHAFRHFTRLLDHPLDLPHLRAVRIGGDQLRADDAHLFRARFPHHAILYTTFGITEVGTIAAMRYQHDDPVPDRIPAGYGHPGRALLVLDEQRRPLPPGSLGELAIVGRYLSSGYVNQEELTHTRFAFDPLDPDQSRYFTGDLATLADDGCCTLWGRRDFQAKINASTVRPGEVEDALLTHPAVREAVALVQPDPQGISRLRAFVSLAQPGAIDVTRLRQHVASRVMVSLVPSNIRVLDAIPRNEGGKPDYVALQALPTVADAARRPTTPLTLALADLWRQVLRIQDPTLDDHFTALGGESLVVADFTAALERALGVPIPLLMVHQAPTLEQQARYLEQHHPARVAAWLQQSAPVRPEPATTTRHPEAILARIHEGLAHYPPFFCVAGAGADPAALIDLGAHLAPHQPLFSFHPRGVDGRTLPASSVHAMATEYIAALRTIQPLGPYHLGGTSFGGLVALEMARSLRAAGETIANLILFDTRPPGYPPYRPTANPRLLALRFARRWLPIGLKETWTLANLRIGLWQRAERWRARLLLALGVPPRALSPMARFATAIEGHTRAARHYRIQPYDGDLVLFRCEQQPSDALFLNAPDMSWGPHVRGRLDVRPTPGRHGIHLRMPHAAILGPRVQALLDQADSR